MDVIGLRKILSEHLKNNSGEGNMNAIIIIAIAFVAGTLLIVAVVSAIKGYYNNGVNDIINDIMH